MAAPQVSDRSGAGGFVDAYEWSQRADRGWSFRLGTWRAARSPARRGGPRVEIRSRAAACRPPHQFPFRAAGPAAKSRRAPPYASSPVKCAAADPAAGAAADPTAELTHTGRACARNPLPALRISSAVPMVLGTMGAALAVLSMLVIAMLAFAPAPMSTAGSPSDPLMAAALTAPAALTARPTQMPSAATSFRARGGDDKSRCTPVPPLLSILPSSSACSSTAVRWSRAGTSRRQGCSWRRWRRRAIGRRGSRWPRRSIPTCWRRGGCSRSPPTRWRVSFTPSRWPAARRAPGNG